MAVPSLLLVARDLLLHDPPRVVAWRVVHESGLGGLPAALRALVAGAGTVDRDPMALLLGASCSAVALALLVAGLRGARARVRAALLGLGALCAVVLPTAALVALGWAMERPYGQDGGVVQVPIAIDLLLHGESPYGADYSATILGRQARVSPFWQAYGGNPLMRHHAYLPGTHLVMLPGYLLARAAGVPFDPRTVTLAALAAAAWMAARLGGRARGAEGALAAAALVLVNPLVYWPQAFGANDVLQAALLLGVVALIARGRLLWAGAVLGLACATKQLAWPYAPFLLAQLSGARSLRGLVSAAAVRRLARPALVAGAVFAAVVAPVLLLDPRAFWGDIVVYNVGLPGADSYPLGGTPGFGAANFLIYAGRVASLREHVSFAPAYLLLAPLCLLLLRRQLREEHPAAALVTGSAALLASVWVSRVAHPNYLVLAAIVLPIGLLVCTARPAGGERAPARWTAEAAVVPLLLLLLAVDLVEHEPLRAAWEDAVAARLPAHAAGPWSLLLPRAGPQLTGDPLGLLFGALAAGIAVAWLMLALLGASARLRVAVGAVAACVLAGAPSAALSAIGGASGTPRAQDAWFAPVSRAARLAAGQSDPAPPREAWSSSFRRDPPAALDEAGQGTPPQRALGRLLGLLRLRDPRVPLALALVLAAALLARRAAREDRVLLFAALALAPPAVMGTITGAPVALALLAVALAVAARGRAGAALAGGAAASAVWVGGAAARALGRAEHGPGRSALAAFACAMLAALAVIVLAGGTQVAWPRLQPALGLPNLLLYAGLAPPAGVLWTMVALVQLVAFARAWRGSAADGAAEAAAIALAGLWLMPAVSPEAVAIPAALVLVSAVRASAAEPRARVAGRAAFVPH